MKRSADYQKERGDRQERRIIEVLTVAPATTLFISNALFMSRAGVLKYLKRMRAAGSIHIADHENFGSGREAPVYALGSDEDHVYTRKARQCQGKKPRPPADVRMAEARVHLRAPLTALELGEKMFISTGRARTYIRRLRAAKVVYIKRYDPPAAGGDQTPVYVVGKQPDAIKRRQTRSERYVKVMTDPERSEREAQRRRTRYIVEKAKSKPQSIFAALGL